MEFNICMPVRMIGGKDCVIKNKEIFSSFGKRCLIVTGGSSAEKSGALRDVTEALTSQGIEYRVFDKVTENPLVSTVIEGGKAAMEFGAEFVVGIGGGSPLDASKAVAICAKNPDYDIDGLYNRQIPSKALPLILVGTTSGTGSEVTGVSVLTNDRDMTKKSISGADCYGAVSFLDPKYTYSMSYNTTVSTALDAFAHSVEGWFSKKCCDIAQNYGRLCLPMIFEGLKALYKTKENPDEQLRDKLYYGSVYAGLELNICGAAFPHTVGYVLTENFGIPHGRACTSFMPLLLKKAKECMPQRYSELFEVLNTTEDELLSIVKALTDVEINATSQEIKTWCSRWVNGNKNFDNSPGGFSATEAETALSSLISQ